jgi:hypothetical protein
VNWIYNLVRKIMRRIFLPHSFYCAPIEQGIEFKSKDGLKHSFIWAKQPDGDTKFRYLYWLSSKLTESQLRDIEKSDSKLEEAHNYKRHERDFRFFDMIFVRCKGYIDEKGSDISVLGISEQIEYLKKWFPDHVERVIYFIFDEAITDTICKKKF